MKNARPFNIWISPREIDFPAGGRGRIAAIAGGCVGPVDAMWFYSYKKEAQDENGTWIE
jgi:hypothetical protein